MVELFKRFVRQNELFGYGDSLLVAVSGGIDSIVLFHLLHASGYRTAIVHCNFGLRGEESDADEVFVRELAQRTGVQLFVKHCSAAEYASRHKKSVQEAARELRYDYFALLNKTTGYRLTALAHHADDNLESFFINLSRNTGLKGLTGMPVKRMPFVRPLLFATRKQIEKYAHEQGLHWREDSSNKSDKYLRNRIRHHLIPVMEKISENFTGSVFATMQNLDETNRLFEQLINQKKNLYLKRRDGNIEIENVGDLLRSEGEILLYYLLRDFGFDRSTVSQLSKAIGKKHPGKWFYSENFRLLLDRDRIITAPVNKKQMAPVVIDSPDDTIDYPVRLRFRILKDRSQFVLEKNRKKAWFDADKISFPMELRPWKKGDRFIPFGMKGSKPVSDLLTDKKLSLIDKERVFLLVSGEEIIWVIGLQSSNRFKVTSSTKTVLEITADTIL